jgi:hypothetical protein
MSGQGRASWKHLQLLGCLRLAPLQLKPLAFDDKPIVQPLQWHTGRGDTLAPAFAQTRLVRYLRRQLRAGPASVRHEGTIGLRHDTHTADLTVCVKAIAQVALAARILRIKRRQDGSSEAVARIQATRRRLGVGHKHPRTA